MKINYNDMVIFARIVESGSFTKAGKKLGIPKSTISQSLSRLEQRLNINLLNRSTRSISLTSIGEKYFNHCQTIIQIGNQAEIEISNVKNMMTGHLKITCPEVSASYFVKDLINGFTELYPSVAIELIVDDRYIDIINNSIDFAFRTGKLQDSNLICRQLGKVSRVLVASSTYLNERGRPAEIIDLDKHTCILHDQLTTWPFFNSSQRKNHKPKKQLVSNSLFFILHLSLAGKGVSLLPQYMVQQHLEEKRLEVVMPSCKIPKNHYYLIQAQKKYNSKINLAFSKYVEQFKIKNKIDI